MREMRDFKHRYFFTNRVLLVWRVLVEEHLVVDSDGLQSRSIHWITVAGERACEILGDFTISASGVSWFSMAGSWEGGYWFPSQQSRAGLAGLVQASNLLPSEAVLLTLREAVMQLTAINTMFEAAKCDNIREGHVPVAVLFSGGLDSMILAALLDECLDPKYEIDLLNVSFDNGSAPDRISARAGVKELKRISPLRRWKLVEIDADMSNLTLETKHVMSLINPT